MANDTNGGGRPILGYVTTDADRVADFVPEAERLIGQGRPPNAIRHLFARTEDAVAYFAKSLARQYGADGVGNRCADCGREAPNYVLRLLWTAQATFRLCECRAAVTQPEVVFSTFHGLCARCLGDWGKRLDSLRWLETMLSWIAVVAFLLFVAEHTAVWLRLIPRRSPLSFLSAACLLAAVLAGMSSWAVGSVRKQRRPGVLRTVMPRDVVFEKVDCVFVRDETGKLRAVGVSDRWGRLHMDNGHAMNSIS